MATSAQQIDFWPVGERIWIWMDHDWHGRAEIKQINTDMTGTNIQIEYYNYKIGRKIRLWYNTTKHSHLINIKHPGDDAVHETDKKNCDTKSWCTTGFCQICHKICCKECNLVYFVNGSGLTIQCKTCIFPKLYQRLFIATKHLFDKAFQKNDQGKIIEINIIKLITSMQCMEFYVEMM